MPSARSPARSPRSLLINNRTFHRMLVDGVAVEYRLPDGRIKGDRVLLVDFDNPRTTIGWR